MIDPSLKHYISVYHVEQEARSEIWRTIVTACKYYTASNCQKSTVNLDRSFSRSQSINYIIA